MGKIVSLGHDMLSNVTFFMQSILRSNFLNGKNVDFSPED